MKISEAQDPELYTAALTVWREARGEPYEGKQGVAQVIYNRMTDAQRRWPRTAIEVCKQRLQFSCWNPNDPNSHKFPLESDAAWKDSCTAVTQVFQMEIPDVTKGANCYYERHIPPPFWAEPEKRTVEIGNHIFFRL